MGWFGSTPTKEDEEGVEVNRVVSLSKRVGLLLCGLDREAREREKNVCELSVALDELSVCERVHENGSVDRKVGTPVPLGYAAIQHECVEFKRGRSEVESQTENLRKINQGCATKLQSLLTQIKEKCEAEKKVAHYTTKMTELNSVCASGEKVRRNHDKLRNANSNLLDIQQKLQFELKSTLQEVMSKLKLIISKTITISANSHTASVTVFKKIEPYASLEKTHNSSSNSTSPKDTQKHKNSFKKPPRVSVAQMSNFVPDKSNTLPSTAPPAGQWVLPKSARDPFETVTRKKAEESLEAWDKNDQKSGIYDQKSGKYDQKSGKNHQKSDKKPESDPFLKANPFGSSDDLFASSKKSKPRKPSPFP